MEEVKLILARRIFRSREINNFKLFAYVFMPEHVHLLLLPSSDARLGIIIGEIKASTTAEYFKRYDPANKKHHILWQKRCYDHNCRTIEDVRVKIEYCHNNPVKRGLIAESANYKWSSNNWYLGEREVPLTIDDIFL